DRLTAPPARNTCPDPDRLSHSPTRSPLDRIRCQQSCDLAPAVGGNGTHRALVPNEDARWCWFGVLRLRPVQSCPGPQMSQGSLRQQGMRCAYGLSRTRQQVIKDESLKNPLRQKPKRERGCPRLGARTLPH